MDRELYPRLHKEQLIHLEYSRSIEGETKHSFAPKRTPTKESVLRSIYTIHPVDCANRAALLFPTTLES